MNNDRVVIEIEDMNEDSRYKNLRVFRDKRGVYFELPRKIEIEPASSDLYFKVDVRTEDRLDLIAHDFYNNSRLWWVIATINKLENPLKIPFGTVLIVPGLVSLYSQGGILSRGES